MKTFAQLRIGDSLYFIDDNFNVSESKIEGIRNVGLSNKSVHLYLISHTDPVITDPNQTIIRHSFKNKYGESVERTYLPCFEKAVEEKQNLKETYVNKQFAIAKQAFNRIKKASQNDNRLKKRIYDFFNIEEIQHNL